MSHEKYTDRTLIEAIKKGGTERQQALHHLYNKGNIRERVVQYIMANQGDVERAKDIFHDGMIIFDRNIQEGKYRGEGSPGGYLYSICRFLWLKALEKEGRVVLKDDDGLLEGIAPLNPEDMVVEKEKEHLLDRIITQLGERCKRLLKLWKLSYSMEEIAKIMNFSSAAMARKNRYRCHQRLMKLLNQQPHLLEMLIR